MNPNVIAKGILRAVIVLLSVALLLYFLYEISTVLVYIIIAAVSSLIGRPIVLFLQRKLKFNLTLAVITTMVLFIGVLIGIILLFIPLVIQQGHNLALLDINQLQSNVESLYREIILFFNVHSIDVEQSIKDSGFISNIDYSAIPDFLNSIVSGLGSFSIGLFSVLFIMFFFMKDSKLFENAILILIPDKNEPRMRRSIVTIKDLLSRYFLGLVMQISILFVIYTSVLLLVGIENAVVIAFLCALLNLIPYIGPLISAFLMLLLSMSSNLGLSFTEIILPKTIWVMIGFAIAQLVDNFFSQPFIFSKSVKSHPLEIFLVIIIAGLLFGIVGMIVAIPFYTALKVILKEFNSDNKVVQQLTKNM